MKKLACSLAFLLIPFQTFAWGPIGHRTVGLIADSLLTPNAKAGVRGLLGNQTLADVANWADAIKSGGGYKQTVWYHFEKISDRTYFIPHLKSLPPDMQRKGGMMTALLVAIDNLKNPKVPLAEKADSLKFFVHFVGDLHQPLHSGRPEDNGAVKIPVTWFGEAMNLHRVWDSGMMLTGHPDFLNPQMPLDQASSNYGIFLIKQYRNKPVTLGFEMEKWLYESMILREAAYDPIYNTDQKKYQDLHLAEIDRRVFEAGVRLADMVNLIFSNTPVPPVTVNFWNEIVKIVGDLHQIISLRP